MMGISYMNLTWFFANRCFAYLLRCNSALHNARLLTFNLWRKKQVTEGTEHHAAL
jgi:hypothetical protein